MLGVDCFNDNYPRADKWANLARASDHDAFKLVTADLVDADATALLEQCDVVFHLAGEPGVRSSWGARFDRYTHHNVAATQRLLEAARELPGKRFVYASSSSVYGDALALPTHEDDTPRPLSPYGVTKLAAEHLCVLYGEEHGVDTVALRYFSVFGPRQRPDMAFRRFCEAIVAGAPIEVFGDGRQTRDFTYVGDIVAATRAAAEASTKPGRVFNIGGGDAVSVNRALETLAGLAGRPLDVRRRRAPVGRRARHGRGHRARADRARLRAGDRPRDRARGRVGVGAPERQALSEGAELDRFLTFGRHPLEAAVPIRVSCPASARTPSALIISSPRSSRSPSRRTTSCSTRRWPRPAPTPRGDTTEVVDHVCRLAVSAGVATGEIAWLVGELESAGTDADVLAEAGVAVAGMESCTRAVAQAVQELADRGGPAEIASSAEALRRVSLQLTALLPRLQPVC